MKSAFLTESGWSGKVPENYLNMRTEMAWQFALQSDHFNIHSYEQVKGYDVVFIIFPKGITDLIQVGIDYGPMRKFVKHILGQKSFIKQEWDEVNKIAIEDGMQNVPVPESIEDDMKIYETPIVEVLKKNNQKVCAIQEGPSNFFNDYNLVTQFNFYNLLSECDIIFAHNEYDCHFYKGLFPQTRVNPIPTLMIVNKDTCPFTAAPENKAIIGGNFCHWYGGFQSYVVATEFQCPIYVPASHCKRKGEEQVPSLNHLPWVFWTKWMEQLSTFRYAVNLMPTVAAGTFNANCAYYGIPCIGNDKVDTQLTFFPELAVDVNDVHQARVLALTLREDKSFYEQVSHHAKKRFAVSVHGNVEEWLKKMNDSIYG